MRRLGVAAVAVALGAFAVVQWLGRTSGSSTAERRDALPGDELVDRPSFVTNHARTLQADPDAVWPWLMQVGWHRGGWYTPRWVDVLLFPQNRPSASRLDPALAQELRVGDVVPDGPPGTAEFVVERVERPRVLVLHSTTHVPVSWRGNWGAGIDWVWIFSLQALPGGGTRMLIRNRATVSPWWLRLAYSAALVPADHIMARGMLRGIDERSSRSMR